MDVLMILNIILFLFLFIIYIFIIKSKEICFLAEIYTYSVVPLFMGIYNLIAYLISKNIVYLALLLFFVAIIVLSVRRETNKINKNIEIKNKYAYLISIFIKQKMNLTETDKILFTFNDEDKYLKISITTCIKIDNNCKRELEKEISKMINFKEVDIFFKEKKDIG